MSATSPRPQTDPLIAVWERFKRSPDFANAKKWASDPNLGEYSLAGFNAAAEQTQERNVRNVA